VGPHVTRQQLAGQRKLFDDSTPRSRTKVVAQDVSALLGRQVRETPFDGLWANDILNGCPTSWVSDVFLDNE
jgi:hypothetical protein